MTTHTQQLTALRRIEGQIRGIQKMIEDGRYCVDILTQLQSVAGAISGVEDKIFQRHLEGCVTAALKGKSETEKQKKIEEVIKLMRKFKKN